MPLVVNTNPGVVPTAVSLANRRMSQVTAMPADRTLAQSVRDHDGRFPTLHSVVDGLGMSWAQQGVWKTVIQRSLVGAKSQMPLRQAIHAQAREQRLDPVTARAILMRALNYVRQNPDVVKSQPALMIDLQKAKPTPPSPPDAADDADAADSDEDDQDDAPQVNQPPDDDDDEAPDAAKSVAQAVEKLIGSDTVSPDELSELVDTYGVDLLASVLKAMLDEGLLTFDGGKFTGQFGKSVTLLVGR